MGIRALLVYPELPPTYWSMRYALPFLGRKAALPPLGLLTVAAMLPPDWELRLLDLNVEPILPRDLENADLVLASAMLVQRPSFERLIQLCRASGKPLVAGGPYPSACHESIQGVDHFVLGEAEVNLPVFLQDFERGQARACYQDPSHPPLSSSPPPRYDLVKRKHYAGAALQFSRGCPHHCEFCDIVELFGHAPRTKSPAQFLGELDLLYDQGWRGSLFIVDDNFIGNQAQVRRLLPALTRWQSEHRYPFSLFTETSLDLASQDSLIDGMIEAGFNMVFVGIETPDMETLKAVGKRQNTRSDLMKSVRILQDKGLEVSSGFIVGFDEDREDIFDRQIRFIEAAAIPTAMVGLLTALPRTRLHERLRKEGRLLDSGTGNNTHDLELNFVPRMDLERLKQGYKRILESIYTPRHYFARCFQLIQRLKRHRGSSRRIRLPELRAFFQSLLRQTFSRYGTSYWVYLLKSFCSRPLMATEIVTLAVKGHHFFTITRALLSLERFKERLETLREDFEVRRGQLQRGLPRTRADLLHYRDRLLKRAQAFGRRVHPDLQDKTRALIEAFQKHLGEWLAEQHIPTR